MIKAEFAEYAKNHTSAETPVLRDLNRETHLKVLFPRMLAGHTQGKLLEMLSTMIQPINILEIGTYTGYSAICLSKGLSKEGVLHTIEKMPEHEDMILNYLGKAGIRDKVKLYIGDALDVIPTIDATFDLIFIDADKENYLNYYKLVFDKLRKGGYIIADNALWGGKVLSDTNSADKETLGITAFNDYIHQDARVENLLLPFRDGLMIIRKL
ncbi:MAG: O-methyltransferase [Bacteroidales bacterium]|nr:O-methyltransferase [Bacteroidales bacterium]